VESITMIPRDYDPHPVLLERMPGLYMSLLKNQVRGRSKFCRGILPQRF